MILMLYGDDDDDNSDNALKPNPPAVRNKLQAVFQLKDQLDQEDKRCDEQVRLTTAEGHLVCSIKQILNS